MADIKLKRRRKPLWPWFTGLIILLALGWGVFEALNQKKSDLYADKVFSEDKDENRFREFSFDTENEDRESKRNSRFINEFIIFAEEGDSYGNGNSYEAEGLSRLADALESIAFEADIEDSMLESRLDNIRSKAEFALENGNAHGDSVRVAMTDAVDAFKIIQSESFPKQNNEIEVLNRTIKKYSPSETESQHKRNMQEFFSQSAMTMEEFCEDLNN